MECNYYDLIEMKKELLQLKNIYNDLNKDFTEMKLDEHYIKFENIFRF